MEPVETTIGRCELVETVCSFTELEKDRVENENAAYHTVVSLVHRLCRDIGQTERLGYSRVAIDSVLESVWELDSRSPSFR